MGRLLSSTEGGFVVFWLTADATLDATTLANIFCNWYQTTDYLVDSANMPSPIAMFDFFLNNCGMLLLLLDVERDVNNCKDC